MKFKSLLFTIILFFIFNSIEAQINLDSIRSNKYYQIAMHPSRDTAYIGQFPQRFAIRPFFSNKAYKFIIDDVWKIGNAISYFPNENNRIGLSGRYKGFTLGFSLPLPANEFIYGKTESFDLYLNTQLSFMNWATDFYYVRRKGFYISNPTSNTPGWIQGSPYPTRKDIKVINIGITSQMIFSRKFSLKAALYQSEKQLKSAGGISLGGTIRFNKISSDSGMITASQESKYKDIKDLTSAGFLTFAVAPGYSYTYVYEDFFFSGTLLVGVGLQFQGYHLTPAKFSPGFKLTTYTSYRLAVGYNADKYFGSAVYKFDNNKALIKDSKYLFSYQGFTLSVGMRFNRISNKHREPSF